MAQTIKKTMKPVLEFVTKFGNMTPAHLEQFTSEFCVARSGSTSTGPREATILRDENGNQLGRKCIATGLWFDNSHFSKNTTINKEAEKVKVALYHKGKKMEKEAQSLLEEAKDITDVMEKVAKYEEYDKALEAAKNIKSTFEVTDDMKQGGFETIDALAKSLNVPVITTLPKKEEEAK